MEYIGRALCKSYHNCDEYQILTHLNNEDFVVTKNNPSTTSTIATTTTTATTTTEASEVSTVLPSVIEKMSKKETDIHVEESAVNSNIIKSDKKEEKT